MVLKQALLYFIFPLASWGLGVEPARGIPCEDSRFQAEMLRDMQAMTCSYSAVPQSETKCEVVGYRFIRQLHDNSGLHALVYEDAKNPLKRLYAFTAMRVIDNFELRSLTSALSGGFLQSTGAVSQELIREITEHVSTGGEARILGHSQGGVVAQVVSYFVARNLKTCPGMNVTKPLITRTMGIAGGYEIIAKVHSDFKLKGIPRVLDLIEGQAYYVEGDPFMSLGRNLFSPQQIPISFFPIRELPSLVRRHEMATFRRFFKSPDFCKSLRYADPLVSAPRQVLALIHPLAYLGKKIVGPPMGEESYIEQVRIREAIERECTQPSTQKTCENEVRESFRKVKTSPKFNPVFCPSPKVDGPGI